MAQIFSLLAGAACLFLGIAGIFTRSLGPFILTPPLTAMYLTAGVLWIIATIVGTRAARELDLGLGAVYAVFGLLGFAGALGFAVLSFLQNSLFHLSLGILGTLVGLVNLKSADVWREVSPGKHANWSMHEMSRGVLANFMYATSFAPNRFVEEQSNSELKPVKLSAGLITVIVVELIGVVSMLLYLLFGGARVLGDG